LPSCSISVSVSESKSAMICGQEPERPSAAVRSSSAFFSTSAPRVGPCGCEAAKIHVTDFGGVVARRSLVTPRSTRFPYKLAELVCREG
jgi:hypothetical protein